MENIKATPIARVRNISKEDFIKNNYGPQRAVLIENLTED